MNSLIGNYGKLDRFIANHSGIPSTTAVAFLIVTCLTTLAIFPNFACSPPLPTPPPTHPGPTPTLTDTPTPTITPTPIPTLLPPVTLEKPEDGSCVECGSELSWSYFYEVLANEYYRLKVWAEGQALSVFYHKQNHFALPTLGPGEYKWTVAIVRSTVPGKDDEQLSEESEWRHFHIPPPAPIVRSISPTNTVRGTSVPVVVSGENFTITTALTVGVPLPAIFVDPSTLTATIPTTLGVGVYTVTVQDSMGRGISSTVFFTVVEPPPPATVSPAPQPVVTLSGYRPPVLAFGGIICNDVTFRWQWPGTLANDEWFAVRVGRLPDIPRSQTRTKEHEYVYTLLPESGEYVWEVAICRGDPAAGACDQRAVSGQSVFSFIYDPECHPPER